MYYEKIIEIIVFILSEMKNNKQLNEVDVNNLSKLGYSQNEINTAFSWIYSRFYTGEKAKAIQEISVHSHRVLHDVEKNMISSEAFGYMIQMRELGLINDMDIETIISKIMVSGYSKVYLEDIKIFIAGHLLEFEDTTNPNRRLLLNEDESVN